MLCDVVVVLNIASFLRQRVVRGEGFGSKYKPYFFGKWLRSSPVVWKASFACFSSFVCPIAGLQRRDLSDKQTTAKIKANYFQTSKLVTDLPYLVSTGSNCGLP